MNPFRIGVVLALSIAAGAVASAEPATQPDNAELAQKWPVEPRWSGPGPMPRHHMVLMWGVPAPYAGMNNPLHRGRKTLKLGEAIYRQHCAACHGNDGAGDGPAGRDLTPAPGNLVWLSDIPERQWNEFMFWTISEGGTALGTSMPPYRQLLTREEIWAVTAYIQENIPFVSRMR